MTNLPSVVSREEWLAARAELLLKEKEQTRARDRINAERRRLPMVLVDEDYVFEGPEGKVGLPALFAGREQLVVHHFMFGPDWDAACPSCSSAADSIAGLRQLHARSTTLVAVSRAPQEKIAAFRERMGWSFPWYSSHGSDFNFHYRATLDDRTEIPGISVFLRVGDDVFHTYSTYGRGIEEFHNGYPYLDLTPLGRQEEWEEPRGRAVPLNRQVGGSGIRYPDQYR